MHHHMLCQLGIALLLCVASTVHAQGKLDLRIPALPENNPSSSTPSQKGMDLRTPASLLDGYQDNDRCQDGTRSSTVQIINGKTYYKCGNIGAPNNDGLPPRSFPPRVRDSDRTELPCLPNAAAPSCLHTPTSNQGSSISFTVPAH